MLKISLPYFQHHSQIHIPNALAEKRAGERLHGTWYQLRRPDVAQSERSAIAAELKRPLF
jgi:hypothetical protein